MIGTFKYLFVLLTISCLSQERSPIKDCPPTYDRSKRKVESFLTSDYLLEERQQSGTVGISTSEVRSVQISSECSELIQVIDNNPKYADIEARITSNKTKYFYRTDEFFFIFWDEKPVEVPDGAVRIKTGPKTIFIVVSEDFQTTWEFYI